MTSRSIADIEADLRALACSDGGCEVIRPRGMHTNGGCHCFDDLRRRDEDVRHACALKARRVMRLHNELIRALQEAAR